MHKSRAQGRESVAGFRPTAPSAENIGWWTILGKHGERGPYCPWPRQSLEEQVVLQIQVHKHLAKTCKFPFDWCRRLVSSEPACDALERLYEAGIELRAVFEILSRTALVGRGSWRHMKPTAARRAAEALRMLRPVLEAVEAARPFEVKFAATYETDATHWGRCWSVVDYVGKWIPDYLEACAASRTGPVSVGKPKDLTLRWCAAALDAVVRERTGQPDDAALGAILHAAFPARFHCGTADDDDHADAFRDLVRRAQGRRR